MKRPEKRRETPKVARNLATEGTLGKATGMILGRFSQFTTTRSPFAHGPDTRADRKHRIPGAPRADPGGSAGVPAEPVEHSRVRWRPGPRRYRAGHPNVASAAGPCAAA